MGNTMDHPLVPLDSDEPVQTKPAADTISELPDEIIELILSKLRLRDAIRTEVLSRRWRHMWEYTTGILDFDFDFYYGGKSSGPIFSGFKRVHKVRYVTKVNKILNAHKASTIETFDVSYDLDVRNKLDIDSWIEFALRKKVRKLKLDLTQRRPKECQDFLAPYQFRPVLDKSKVSCLTSLSLRSVKFTDEVLNYLLSNCPFLESVCVDFLSLDAGVHLAPCPNMKHLEIGSCYRTFLDISSSPKLTSFVFLGSENTRLDIDNVPNLTHVTLGGSFCEAIVYRSRTLLSFLFQIKKLTLELPTDTTTESKRRKFPELKNLNELELTCADIVSCASLIKACPNLYRVSVKHTLTRLNEVHKRKKWSINKCLKVVELEGFKGTEMESEFYECLLSSAPSLEKIIVDIKLVNNDAEKSKIDKSVRRLTRKISPAAKLLVILSR